VIDKKTPTTENQVYRILSAANTLRIGCGCGCLELFDFNGASEAITKLETDVREMQRTRGHIWTEAEVRSRLEHYHEDDSMYYAKVPQLKPVV
jgi:hypothetical protein